MFGKKDKGKSKEKDGSKGKGKENDKTINKKDKTNVNLNAKEKGNVTNIKTVKAIPKTVDFFSPGHLPVGVPKPSLSTASSLSSVHAFSRWQYRTREHDGLDSFLQNKKIAFLPDRGVADEILELEEKLEHEHHQDRDRDRTIMAEKRKPKPPRDSRVERSVMNIKSKQQIKKSIQKAESGRKGYDFVPRPFRAHMEDIKKRRMRKVLEIMSSPDEIYTISEKDKRVKFAPQGTLIFHVLELKNLAVNDSSFTNALPISFYCVLSIGTLKRTSKIVHCRTMERIRVDYTAHFSIEVPEWRESPLNIFMVELWSYQDPEMHFIVGSSEIHVYEFIRNQHEVKEFQLFSDGIKVGKIFIEYAFAYGYFGYGHSNHLKNPKNPIMETASHSMYPRIRIGADQGDLLDKVYRVRMPEQLKVFTFHSLILEINDAIETLSTRKKKRLEDTPTKPIIVQQVTFEDDKPIHCRLHMNIYQKEVQPDFNDTFGEFICFGSRKTRLEYLTNLATGRMRDIFENEAGVLFRPFKDSKEAEKIQGSEINHPGYLVHPKKIPCVTSLGTPKLTREDEKFQNAFPTVRREQGYLNVLFGYQEKPKASEFLNDMDAPLYKEAGKSRRCNCRRWFRKVWLHIAAFFNAVSNFIFPEVSKPPPVPEISVTTPTPPGSTTKVFAYFAKDSKDLGISKLDKLQAATEVLMQLADRQAEDPDEDSDSSSSSSEDEQGQQFTRQIFKFKSQSKRRK